MAYQDQSIRRKLITAMMLTALVVLVVSGLGYTVQDLLSYRRNLAHGLSATAAVLAENSAAPLATKDLPGAHATLLSLRADPRVMSAALYDVHGHLFARYPVKEPVSAFPSAPGQTGDHFANGHLVIFQPVMQDNARLGTLYLRSGHYNPSGRLRIFGGIVVLVLLGSAAVALVIANVLQRRITEPVLVLTEMAKVISERGDYSLRAEPAGRDEIGVLTGAFNRMLSRIEEQTEALNRNEKALSFMASIVESSDNAIVGKNLDGTVVSWNSAAERMFGYTAQEMIGQSITRIQAPDRPEEETYILAEARQGRTRHYETVRRRKDGRLVALSLVVSPIKSATGEIVGVSSIAQDITERKLAAVELQESRAGLSAIIGSAMDAIISINADQRITVFNQSAEKMFGCPAREAMGQPLDRFIPMRFRELHRRQVAEFGHTGVTSRAMGNMEPLSGVRANGEEFPIEASISHIELGDQHVYTVILRDITERKRAEDQVLRLNAELEQRVEQRTQELTAANKELESFTYSVAHDLRAPLRHLDAFSRILQEDFAPELPDEAQRYLDSIRKSTGRMSQLVDDLLNLARLGRQELKRLPTPLDGLVEQAIADLKRETEGRRIDWRIEPLPAVECDSGLMKQVFANLLSNAVKYTRPRAEAVIEVGSRRVDGSTAVFVRDNGVGFNMKYADKLFGVFQRFHRAEEFEGTGVGLATVDRIIRKHGGQIWAEAAVDRGATFYFTLAGMGPDHTASAAAATGPDGAAQPTDNQAEAADQPAGQGDHVTPQPGEIHPPAGRT
jgi:PAS domain S-box-containing protein